MRPSCLAVCSVLLTCLAGNAATAQEPDDPPSTGAVQEQSSATTLPQLRITRARQRPSVAPTTAPSETSGPATPSDAESSQAASEFVLPAARVNAYPVSHPGEVLEVVPGLAITQHSGEGKANQYFLRGFNLDHGTDLAISVDGMPINMRTHGHGQGYADLNFLIP